MMGVLDGLMMRLENERCESVGNDRVDSMLCERDYECGIGDGRVRIGKFMDKAYL